MAAPSAVDTHNHGTHACAKDEAPGHVVARSQADAQLQRSQIHADDADSMHVKGSSSANGLASNGAAATASVEHKAGTMRNAGMFVQTCGVKQRTPGVHDFCNRCGDPDTTHCACEAHSNAAATLGAPTTAGDPAHTQSSSSESLDVERDLAGRSHLRMCAVG